MICGKSIAESGSRVYTQIRKVKIRGNIIEPILDVYSEHVAHALRKIGISNLSTREIDIRMRQNWPNLNRITNWVHPVYNKNRLILPDSTRAIRLPDLPKKRNRCILGCFCWQPGKMFRALGGNKCKSASHFVTFIREPLFSSTSSLCHQQTYGGSSI